MARLKGEERARYVAGMFDRISGRYDLLNRVITGGMDRRWRHKAIDLAVGEDRGEALDVATGTGDLALELAGRPGISRVVGLDFSPGMLSLASKKSGEASPSRDVDWIRGDALALPFPDSRFLCVTCGFGLRNLSDVEAGLAEMIRVTRPGGRVVVLDMYAPEGGSILNGLVRLYTRRIVPRLGGFLAGDREAYAYLPESAETFLRPGELAKVMERLGLARVRYNRMGMGTVAVHVGERPPQAERP